MGVPFSPAWNATRIHSALVHVVSIERQIEVERRRGLPNALVLVALLESMWIRARGIMEFYFRTEDGKVNYRSYLSRSWRPDKPLAKRLEGYLAIINKDLAHLLDSPHPDTFPGFPIKMPQDLVKATRQFTEALRQEGSEHATLFESALHQVDLIQSIPVQVWADC